MSIVREKLFYVSAAAIWNEKALRGDANTACWL